MFQWLVLFVSRTKRREFTKHGSDNWSDGPVGCIAAAYFSYSDFGAGSSAGHRLYFSLSQCISYTRISVQSIGSIRQILKINAVCQWVSLSHKRVERSTGRNFSPIFTKLATKVTIYCYRARQLC